MLKIKYFFEKNRMIIMIGLVILICSVAIAFGVHAQITSKTKMGRFVCLSVKRTFLVGRWKT